jgi:hypothetical protein
MKIKENGSNSKNLYLKRRETTGDERETRRLAACSEKARERVDRRPREAREREREAAGERRPRGVRERVRRQSRSRAAGVNCVRSWGSNERFRALGYIQA